LPDLDPCDIDLFHKLKMKLMGRRFWNNAWHPKGIGRFETVPDIQRESEAVLDSIEENDSHGAFEARKKKKGSLYTFARSPFWKRWQPKLSKLSQHFFFYLVRAFPHSTSYFLNLRWNKSCLMHFTSYCNTKLYMHSCSSVAPCMNHTKLVTYRTGLPTAWHISIWVHYFISS
jgi:hypothetical protein